MSKSQLKLMAALAGLVLLVVGASGLIAQRELRDRELQRIGRELEHRARLAGELARGVGLSVANRSELDPIADRAGQAAGARVTLIAADGSVVGDSDVPLARLPVIANHGDRPEVSEALAGRTGRSSRQSQTVGRKLHYLAVPFPGGGAVRVAMEMSDLEAALADLRAGLLVSGAIGLAAAVALSYALAWFTLRPLREVQRLTSAIAGGDLEYRLPGRLNDEFGDIARSIHEMADQLRQRLDEATWEKERLQAVLNGMVEGVLVVDREGRIVLANERLRAFFGLPDELNGHTLLEVVRHPELDASLRAAAMTDDAIAATIEVERPVSRTFRVHAVRFPSGTDTRIGTVAVLHDTTEISRLEKVRREFVANASHELRTPLTAIQGFAETLLHSSDLSEANVRSYLEVIDRHARRLGNLVGDLLGLSEIEGREHTVESSRVDLTQVVELLVQDVSGRAREKKLAISTACKGDPALWTDANSVERIVRNLLDNAIQYTESGGHVAVQIGGEPDSVRIQVADTGVGIPESDRARIFERFYRVDQARSRALGGTGLGLAIVKHLVQNLGGEIAVESEVGRGSTFSVSLPRRR